MYKFLKQDHYHSSYKYRKILLQQSIAKIIFESLKQKPEIEILEKSFKVLGKEYKINPIIFEKVKKLQIINQKIGDLKL